MGWIYAIGFLAQLFFSARILIQWVLDRDDRVLLGELGVDLGHFLSGVLAALEVVLTVLVELGGSNVKSQSDVFAELVARLFNGFNDEVKCCLGGVGRSEERRVGTEGRR